MRRRGRRTAAAASAPAGLANHLENHVEGLEQVPGPQGVGTRNLQERLARQADLRHIPAGGQEAEDVVQAELVQLGHGVRHVVTSVGRRALWPSVAAGSLTQPWQLVTGTLLVQRGGGKTGG
jgi:hypothetical protein